MRVAEDRARTNAVELARAEDLPAIVAISNWAAEHTIANFALEPETLEDWTRQFDETRRYHPWLVARRGDRVLGFAKSSPHNKRGAYDATANVSIYVDPTCHRQGVATALYGALIPVLKAQGYVTLIAGITSGHEPSERLHARFGFVRCGLFPRVGWKLDRWRDVGYHALALDDSGRAPAALRTVEEAWTARERTST